MEKVIQTAPAASDSIPQPPTQPSNKLEAQATESQMKPSEALESPAATSPKTAMIAGLIDDLDEKLALGEISEGTYKLEVMKVRGDLDGLRKLLVEDKIPLSQYLGAREAVESAFHKPEPKQRCRSCGTELLGIETHCPRCGFKQQ